MASNGFYRFAFQGEDSNTLSDSLYVVDSMRYTGNERGIARRALVNKCAKQSASMAYAIGEAVVFNSALDIADDDTGLSNLIAYLKRAFLPYYVEADANKFVVINSTGDGIVFRSLNSATTSVGGIIILASAAEVIEAINNEKAITPLALGRDKANGVAPLTANRKVPSDNLPQVTSGVMGIIEMALVSDVTAGTSAYKAISPSTLGKGKANGVAPLDGDIKVSMSYLHTNEALGLPTLGSDLKILDSFIRDASLSASGKMYIASETELEEGIVTNKAVTPFLIKKGKASGLAPLDSNTKVPLAYFILSGVTAGSYYNVTVDQYGRVTNGSNDINASALTSGVFPIARHPISAIAPGTYNRVSVDVYGHVTSGFVQSSDNMVPKWSARVARSLNTVYVAATNGYLHCSLIYGYLYINDVNMITYDWNSKSVQDTFVFPIKAGDTYKFTGNSSGDGGTAFRYFVPVQ